MPRGRVHVGEDGEVDAVGRDDAFSERPHDLVIAAGQRQGDVFWHLFASSRPVQFSSVVKLHLTAKSSLRLKLYRGLWISFAGLRPRPCRGRSRPRRGAWRPRFRPSARPTTPSRPNCAWRSAVTDLLAGRTQIMFSAVSVVLPHIQAGTLKALAWAAPKRGSVLPDVPTVAEVGLPELDASIWFGLMAPAGTPKDTQDKIARTLNAALKSEELRGQLDKMGYVPLGGTPEDFTRYVDSELKKWTAAAEAAGTKK
ncbi:MAG: hypothetical protein EXQ83_14535 [Xanthobacteraceae bacterium]|nr:hypothetical protein [Xanthobacteraceae bacterium]